MVHVADVEVPWLGTGALSRKQYCAARMQKRSSISVSEGSILSSCPRMAKSLLEPGGSVVYWRVSDFDAMLQHLEEHPWASTVGQCKSKVRSPCAKSKTPGVIASAFVARAGILYISIEGHASPCHRGRIAPTSGRLSAPVKHLAQSRG